MDPGVLSEYMKEASRIEEDSLHSSKSHYNAAARWRLINLVIGLPNAVLAALAGYEAFQGNNTAAGIMAILVATVGAILTFLNPSDRASSHQKCAGEYHALRNRARIFVNIFARDPSFSEELRIRFEELATRRDNLNATSPQIPYWAFKKAKAGIDSGEAKYTQD